jgi:hypothetical protein
VNYIKHYLALHILMQLFTSDTKLWRVAYAGAQTALWWKTVMVLRAGNAGAAGAAGVAGVAVAGLRLLPGSGR